MKVAFWAAAGCLGLVAASCSGDDRDFSSGNAGQSDAGAGARGDGGNLAEPAGGAEHGVAGDSPGLANGGEPVGGQATALEPTPGGAGGAGGAPIDELAPPEGAFAWFKATKADVVTGTAKLADGNDFIKSFWAKTNITAEGLQPDADGGSTATAIYTNVVSGQHSMTHVLATSSSAALKTVRIKARMGAWRYLWLGGPAIPGGVAPYVFFDLQDGTVVSPYAATGAIKPLKNLWYSCEVTMASGPEIWLGFSNSTVQNQGGPLTAKALAWIQQAEVEQTYVTSWHDRIGGRDFNDPTGGWRWLEASPELNGLSALQSYYVASPFLTAGAADDWQFLHDGSGGSVVLLQQQEVPSKGYKSSLGTEYGGAEQGMSLGVSAADSKLWGYRAANANGEKLFAVNGGGTTGVKWLAATYATAQAPDAQLYEDGVMVASANAAAEPTLSPSSAPLQLGSASGTPNSQVHEVLVYDRALSSQDISRLTAYFASQLKR